MKGFTLAEVLITLAIIGVVAAISIPSVISNSQQQEFKTGLRKAVSVLNSAITMNMAIDGESPYDNKDLTRYLMRHMNILKTTSILPYSSYTKHSNGSTIHGGNSAFYTTDGMRFEFNAATSLSEGKNKLHESDTYACTATSSLRGEFGTGGKCGTSNGLVDCSYCGGCGSLGLNSNPNNTTLPP
ncbi:MAG: type II secretion system protein, partial [bacterium]|nr:type II secretion system protein [bacterium]